MLAPAGSGGGEGGEGGGGVRRERRGKRGEWWGVGEGWQLTHTGAAGPGMPGMPYSRVERWRYM